MFTLHAAIPSRACAGMSGLMCVVDQSVALHQTNRSGRGGPADWF